MPDVSGLVTNTAFNSKTGIVENNEPSFSELVNNTIFNDKIGEVEKVFNQSTMKDYHYLLLKVDDL